MAQNDTKSALEHRKLAKKRKPHFVVKESKFTSGVKRRWRFPRGKHSKVRQMHKGRPAMPGPGYGSPRSVRGLDPTGLKLVLVHNEKELSLLDPSKQSAMISGNVGNKKRVSLLAKAQEMKISILNGDVAKILKRVQDSFESRMAKKKERVGVKTKKAESKKKVDAKKETEAAKKEKEASVEDKIEAEAQKQKDQKTEAEKIITKRQ